MAEQENTTTARIEGAATGSSSNEVDMTMLDDKLTELGMIEEELFSADGQIGAQSNDSIIDKTYIQEIQKAQDIKTKIEIVEGLIIDFRKNLTIHGMIQQESLGKYATSKDKKLLSDINTQLEKLMEKYPQSKNQLIKFIESELKTSNFYIHFYENTGNKEDKQIIPTVLQGHYEIILQDSIPSLEKLIKDIEKNNFITDNESFLNYLIQDNNYKKLGGNIGNKLNEIFQMELVQEGFNDNEAAPNYKDTFGYGTLVRLMEKPNGEVKKLNEMYQDPKKHRELIAYIDTSSQEIKDGLLASKKIKDIYIKDKKSEIIDIRDIATLGKLSDDVIVKLSNISDPTLKKTVYNMMREILKNSHRGKETLMIGGFHEALSQNSSKSSFDINVFLSDGGTLDNMIEGQPDARNKIKIIQTFQAFIESEFRQSVPGDDGDLLGKIETKRKNLEDTLKNTINKAIEEIKQKHKNNPKVQLDIASLDDPSGDKKTSEFERSLTLLEKYENFPERTQMTRPENKDKKETPLVNAKELQQAQQSLDRNGLGKNRTIDSQTGKIVSKEWLEKKQLAIANGTQIPKDDTSTTIDTIGRRGQIEFGNNNEMIFTSSLGYRFELDNNIYGLKDAIEITETFDYLDRIGLGYFGDNLQNMAETTKFIFGNKFSHVSLGESTFLEPQKLNHFIDMFKTIGFIGENQVTTRHNAPEVMDIEMTSRLSGLHIKNKSDDTPEGNAFIKGSQYDANNFRKFVSAIRDHGCTKESDKV